MSIQDEIKLRQLSRNVVNSPFDTNKRKCYKYKLELSRGDKSYGFLWYDSIYNYVHSTRLNKWYALDSLLTDYRAYRFAINFPDFCSQFDYDEDKGWEIYTRCRDITRELEAMFTNDELAELSAYLNDRLG